MVLEESLERWRCSRRRSRAIPRAGVGVLDDVHLKIVVKLWFLGILILS